MKEMRVDTKFGIDGFTLKWIAILAMVIDHTGAILFPQLLWMRIIGRMAFPIFCFLLVEGYVHTKDVKKYGVRLFLFALLSEVPFDLMTGQVLFYTNNQNVFITLFIGLVIMIVLMNQKSMVVRLCVMVGGIFLAEYLRCDYGAGGILMIVCFFLFRQQKLGKFLSVGVINIFLFGGIQKYGILSFFPIYLYNGKRGYGMKYFFYFFYPIHMLILYGIRIIL